MFLEIHTIIIDYKKQNLDLDCLCKNVPGWKSFGPWIDKGEYLLCDAGFMHCFGGYYSDIFFMYDLFYEVNGKFTKFSKPECKILDFQSVLVFIMLCLGNYKNLTTKFQIIIKNQNIPDAHKEEIEKIRDELTKFVTEQKMTIEVVCDVLNIVDTRINEIMEAMKIFSQINKILREQHDVQFNDQEKDKIINILNHVEKIWDIPQLDHQTSTSILKILSELHEKITYIKFYQ